MFNQLKDYLDYTDEVHQAIQTHNYNEIIKYTNFDLHVIQKAYLQCGYNEKIEVYMFKHSVNFTELYPYISHTSGYGKKMIKFIIGSGIDLESELDDEYGPKLINIICSTGTYSAIKLLIDHNIDLESIDNRGLKPIHIACSERSAIIVKLLIDNGVDLESVDRFKRKPIHLACRGYSADIVKLLIANNVDLESDHNSWKPIHIACYYGGFEIIKLLLDRDIDLTSRIRIFNNVPSNYNCLDLLKINRLLKIDEVTELALIIEKKITHEYS